MRQRNDQITESLRRASAYRKEPYLKGLKKTQTKHNPNDL